MSETKVSSMFGTDIIPFVIALETCFQGLHAWLISSMSETGINLSHYRLGLGWVLTIRLVLATYLASMCSESVCDELNGIK